MFCCIISENKSNEIHPQKEVCSRVSTTSNMDHQLLRQTFRQKFSVMKTKKKISRQIVCFWHFDFEDNRNTSVYIFITEIFDVINDDPYST